MNTLTNKNTQIDRTLEERSRKRRSLRELTRRYFAHETKWQFIIEAVLFGIIVAISAWPMLAAAEALTRFIQRTAS